MNINDKISEKFRTLVEEGKTIRSSSGWDGREYYRHPSDVDYRRFRTEAMNIVRRACGETSDHYQELRRIAEAKETSGNSYYFKDCFGVLQAAQNDFVGGHLFDLKALVAADILDDFLDQAETLIKAGYYVPAASLAGAVLEDALRKLCEAHDISVPARTSIDRLNADLARSEVYSKLVQKRITSLADIRNNADHGHFSKFSKEDVDDMINWTKRFTADYLG